MYCQLVCDDFRDIDLVRGQYSGCQSGEGDVGEGGGGGVGGGDEGRGEDSEDEIGKKAADMKYKQFNEECGHLLDPGGVNWGVCTGGGHCVWSLQL